MILYRLLAVFIAACSAGGLLANPQNCPSSQLSIALQSGGSVEFEIAIAATAAERAKGLMHVSHLPEQSGMLFVYNTPRPVRFWMKNTLIPLDMLFANAEGVITSIHNNAIPHDLSPIFGGNDIQYVLEINGGIAAAQGIIAGDQLQHHMVSKEMQHLCE